MKGKDYISYFFLFFTIVVFYIVLFCNPYIYNYPVYRENHYLFAIVAISLYILFLIVEIWRVRSIYRISILDLSLMLLFSTVLFSRMDFISSGQYMNEILLNLLVLAGCYIVIRKYIDHNNFMFFVYIIAISLIIQVVYVAFTYIANHEEVKSYLFLKGTLDNPGLCAALIVIISPVYFHILSKKPILRICFCLVLGITLFLLNSRSAYLSLLIICIYFYKERIAINKHYTRTVKILLIGCTPVLIYLLFIIRPESIVGRLFIWKLTIDNFLSHPVKGVGYGEFPHSYEKWQAIFFETKDYDLSSFNILELPKNCFNEPLQLIVELGILGGVFFLLVIVCICRGFFSISRHLQQMFKSMLLGVLIISFFSFPFHSLPILFFCILILASMSNFNTSRYDLLIRGRIVRYLCILSLVVCLFSLKYFINKNIAIGQWKEAISMTKTNPYSSLLMYQQAYPFLEENGSFLLQYGISLFQSKRFEDCTRIFRESQSTGGSLDASLYLGRAQQALGNLPIAELTYLNVIYSSPLKIKPKYFLLKLYLEKRDTLNAIRLGDNILKYPVRITSRETIQIQHFALETIRQLESRN